jgi:hypothetical protein
MDISAGGVCLQVPRRFEPGTLLTIVLPGEKSGQSSDHLVRIRWIKGLPDGAWLIGCLFTKPLEDEDLDQLLLVELPTTATLPKPNSGTL